MNKFFSEFKQMDKSIFNVMRYGVRFSFIISLFSVLLLSIYISVHNTDLFYIGISLFETSSFFLVAFISYAFIFNKLKGVVKK